MFCALLTIFPAPIIPLSFVLALMVFFPVLKFKSVTTLAANVVAVDKDSNKLKITAFSVFFLVVFFIFPPRTRI